MKKIILMIAAVSGITAFSQSNSIYKNSFALSTNASIKSICFKVNDKHDRQERRLELKEVRCPKKA